MMHDREKSDSAIVATKPTNKTGIPAAESVEPRAGTEGNAKHRRGPSGHRRSRPRGAHRNRATARLRTRLSSNEVRDARDEIRLTPKAPYKFRPGRAPPRWRPGHRRSARPPRPAGLAPHQSHGRLPLGHRNRFRTRRFPVSPRAASSPGGRLTFAFCRLRVTLCPFLRGTP
jgi:hypothetical protein